jgi:AcrR family transcriptional regulator
LATNKERAQGTGRREQIVTTTISLLSRYGLTGTTTARIARDVGISEPALYRHFLNKEEIILAALDSVSSNLISHMYEASLREDHIPQKIHEMSAGLYEFVMSHPEEAAVLFEVFSASRDTHLKQSLQDMFLGSMGIMEQLLREGIRNGDVLPDIDVELTAWKIMSLGITLNFAAMLGLNHVLTEDRALSAVDQLLEEISTKSRERRVSG